MTATTPEQMRALADRQFRDLRPTVWMDEAAAALHAAADEVDRLRAEADEVYRSAYSIGQVHSGAEAYKQQVADLRAATTEPPRIEDLAPGTTFLARTSDGSLSHEDRLWMVTDSGDVISTRAHYILGRAINSSTIRDVSAPAVTE